MKLWGGRFTKETDQFVHNFNESISFDQKFYKQDIAGSIAHVTMLARQGILSAEDKEVIVKGQVDYEDLKKGDTVIQIVHADDYGVPCHLF